MHLSASRLRRRVLSGFRRCATGFAALPPADARNGDGRLACRQDAGMPIANPSPDRGSLRSHRGWFRLNFPHDFVGGGNWPVCRSGGGYAAFAVCPPPPPAGVQGKKERRVSRVFGCSRWSPKGPCPYPQPHSGPMAPADKKEECRNSGIPEFRPCLCQCGEASRHSRKPECLNYSFQAFPLSAVPAFPLSPPPLSLTTKRRRCWLISDSISSERSMPSIAA